MVETAAAISTATLSSYLADHKAGAGAGIQMAEELAETIPGNEFFDSLVKDIKSDQDTLVRLMKSVGASESTLKEAGMLAVERVSSAMSGVGASTGHSEELGTLRTAELLSMGIMGKLCLWQAMDELSDADERLGGFNFKRLMEGAESQIAGLAEQRLKLARKAFLR